MHELSIALGIVDLAETESERLGGKVTAVHLRIGALSGVAADALRFSFDVATADTVLAGSRLVIEEVPATVFCHHCNAEITLPSIQSFVCPRCRLTAPDVRSGRELELVALEILE
jgi:hydrogenase nickel incorporation protein HypA/HybF